MSFDLKKTLPKPGTCFYPPVMHGSADAYLLAQVAVILKTEKRMLTVIVSNAIDAQRLLEEIPWFYNKSKLQNQINTNQLRCFVLPDWETLPYDVFSPHQDLISKRLATLYAVQNSYCDVLIVHVATALLRMAPPCFLTAYTCFLKLGDKLNETYLKLQLTLASYTYVTQVILPGECSIHDNLIDIFPMGSTLPYRLNLVDNVIKVIRAFNVDTQRSLYEVHEIRLLPVHEFPMHEIACKNFCSRWRELFSGNSLRSVIYKNISKGIPSAGVEYYLPLFFKKTVTLFEYLPPQTMFVTIGDIDNTIKCFWNNTYSRYNLLKANDECPILTPTDIFLNNEDFHILIQSNGRWSIRMNRASSATALSAPIPNIAINRYVNDPVINLRTYLLKTNKRVMLCAGSYGRCEILQQYFKEHNLHMILCDDNYQSFITNTAPVMLGVAPLHTGFELLNEQVSFITETELYSGSARSLKHKRYESSTQIEHIIRDLSELKIGDPVVHINHGIGRYMGLLNIDLGEGETEFLQLTYAKDAKLYIPVSQLHVISRYSGAVLENTPLHILGSNQWEKAKRKAAQQVRDIAAELLDLYSQRIIRKGYAFKYSAADYQAFIENFGFEETPDQIAAIDAVIADMTSDKSMDRLICGDVGFGKTEVALRAAFVAVMGGKQVAILAPTTLLAEQHAQIFVDRFSNWPVRIAELSRLRTNKEIKEAVEKIANGTIDIIIGTHKLLSNNIYFFKLGLVIIDEEHRFGVRQKEALKSLRIEVDVLTLTATPIPRTLSMALEGLRDFSVIATAPQKRLAIKTFVCVEGEIIIREACLRELKRGGQIYFLHNEVETIENRKIMLEALLPEARILIAHGKIHERNLEKVMRDFVAQRANILLCTTIIETGIDVPTANTIIMHRADKFGLAQLHQLRGRVGRSHHQAYAYLLVNDIQDLTQQAQRRLEAIQKMEALGSGFYLAMHDLEIRGAGEILGSNQSGEIYQVGFQMYSEMLNEAVCSLKSGKEPNFAMPFSNMIEVNLHIPTLLPAKYCANVHERLSLYKRLSDCNTQEDVDILQEELIDRFGKSSEPVRALIETHRLRILAKSFDSIIKIDAYTEFLLLQFKNNLSTHAERILQLVQKNNNMKLSKENKLQIIINMPNLEARVSQIKKIIKSLIDE